MPAYERGLRPCLAVAHRTPTTKTIMNRALRASPAIPARARAIAHAVPGGPHLEQPLRRYCLEVVSRLFGYHPPLTTTQVVSRRRRPPSEGGRHFLEVPHRIDRPAV